VTPVVSSLERDARPTERPPVFGASEPPASPDQVTVDSSVEATVTFTGDGPSRLGLG
jgi:hypothetical protein